MKEGTLEKMLEIGIRLSAEKDYNSLLEGILTDAMSLTSCDAGTLYLVEGDVLVFKIMRNETMRSYQGGQGEPVDLPPVPLSRESVCALAVLEDRPICVEDVRRCTEYDLSGPIRYDAMTGYHTQSMLVIPMKSRKGKVAGVLQLINAKDEGGSITSFAKEEIRMVESIASMAAVAIENMRYVEEIKGLFYSFVQVLSKAIDEKTPYNAEHTRNMVRCGGHFIDYLNEKSLEAGKGLCFTPSHKDEFLMSIWLHDIGKLVIPLDVMNKVARLTPQEESDIRWRFKSMKLLLRIRFLEGGIGRKEMDEKLREIEEAWQAIQKVNPSGCLPEGMSDKIGQIGRKTFVDEEGQVQSWLIPAEVERLQIQKGTLSEEERRVMESHVSVTSRLLAEIDFSGYLKRVPLWASSHHELLDGSGYPNHLKGEEVPYEVRILTILDIFDALTADDRPYKPGIPVGDALAILEEMAQKEGKLDGGLVREFTESRCWERP